LPIDPNDVKAKRTNAEQDRRKNLAEMRAESKSLFAFISGRKKRDG
jgi:hypothetical protein